MCKFATKQRTGVIGVLVGVLRVLISIFDVFGIGVVYLLYLVFHISRFGLFISNIAKVTTDPRVEFILQNID